MAHAWVPYHNAGGEVMAHTMLRHLVSRGHQVDVLLSSTHEGIHEPYEVDGITVYPRTGRADPSRWFLGGDKPDVMMAHLENVPRMSALAKMYKVPMVHLAHNTHAATVSQLRRAYPNLAVYNSQWMRDYILGYLGEDARDSIVVRPPVIAEDYATTPGDRITLVNLWPDKGSDLFYRLAGLMPHVDFLGVTGGYGLQRTDERPNIDFVEHVPPDAMREKVYARTRILLMPSSYESWGRVAAEAMCSGIPVIAHPTPGLTECLGGAGFLIDRDDTDAWVTMINKLQKKTAYDKASKAAKKRSLDFDPTDELAMWADAIEGLATHGTFTRRS